MRKLLSPPPATPRPALLTVALALLVTLPDSAAAEPEPLRIAIECQTSGRTKACPAYLLGFVEQDPLFLSSPRGEAQVTVYYSAIEVASVDRVHLRFVGDLPGAPPVLEIDLDLDTRTDDDSQRAQLRPGFVRGVALYLAAVNSEAVQIHLAEVDRAAIAAPETTPWGVVVDVGGLGFWTSGYRSLNATSKLTVSRVERDSRIAANLGGSWGTSRQPPLVIHGEEISLDTDQYSVNAGVAVERHLAGGWAFGAETSTWRDDPAGQFRQSWDANVGVEWNQFASDDPRGNRLAVTYKAGWRVDRYQTSNVIRERFATYPTGAVSITGNVRKDKIGIGLSLSAETQLDKPWRRHTLSASPFIEWQLGAHVDLGLSFSISQQAMPAPIVDPGDYEQVIRARYAEPVQAFGSLNLRFHWDRTNGVRNNRFGG
jgi:hypothetical protein